MTYISERLGQGYCLECGHHAAADEENNLSLKVDCFDLINEMLLDLDKQKANWDEEWDGHYGDLSAREYDSIMGQRMVLIDLKSKLEGVKS